jgi:hypothetical protein
VVIVFKLGNTNRSRTDQLSGNASGIVTILQDYYLWRVSESVCHHDEIPVSSNNDEPVALGVVPNLAIRCAPAQANLSDMNRAGEKILNQFHQFVGEILIKEELYSG